MAIPLIPFAIKEGAAGMAMIYSTATGQYVIGAATAAWMAAKGVAVVGAIAAGTTAISAAVTSFFAPPWYAPLFTPVGVTCFAVTVCLLGGAYGYRQYKKGNMANLRDAFKDFIGWLKSRVLHAH